MKIMADSVFIFPDFKPLNVTLTFLLLFVFTYKNMCKKMTYFKVFLLNTSSLNIFLETEHAASNMLHTKNPNI